MTPPPPPPRSEYTYELGDDLALKDFQNAIYTRSGSHLWTVGSDPLPSFRQGGCLVPVWSPWSYSFVRCRKCLSCRWVKRKDWENRARVEIRVWDRTWFVTLTFAKVPENPYDEVQKYLKRYRKKNGSDFKYLCVQEHGTKTGRLHYHLLIHCDEKIKRRDVEDKWHGGYSRSRLVHKEADDVAHRYVCKYLLKEGTRPKASRNYGIPF